MKVYLDTNVLVSAFTTRGLSADVVRLVLTEHDLLTGEMNMAELHRVLRTRIGLPAAVVREIEALLREHTVVPKPDDPGELDVRDPSDRWVLASAIAANADMLVATGDEDLLDLADRSPLPILSPRGFWDFVRRAR